MDFDDLLGGRGAEERSWYDTAQICLNGHVINDSSQKYPEFNQEYCDKCGGKSITECPNCRNNIKGSYHSPGVIPMHRINAPAFCSKCGKSFPWTETKIRIARELIEEIDGLSREEKESFVTSIEDISKDGPQIQIASVRVKRFLARAGKEIAGGLRDIIVDIASETAKKALKM